MTGRIPNDLVWLPLPFVVNYSDYGAPFPPCEYAMDAFGVVHLHGLFKYATLGSYASWGPSHTLPVGFRPRLNEIFHPMGYSASAQALAMRLDVLTDGTIIGNGAAGQNWAGNWQSLSGVSFQAAPL